MLLKSQEKGIEVVPMAAIIRRHYDTDTALFLLCIVCRPTTPQEPSDPG